MKRDVRYGQVWQFEDGVVCMAIKPWADTYPHALDAWHVLILSIDNKGRPYDEDPFISYSLATQTGWRQIE